MRHHFINIFAKVGRNFGRPARNYLKFSSMNYKETRSLKTAQPDEGVKSTFALFEPVSGVDGSAVGFRFSITGWFFR